MTQLASSHPQGSPSPSPQAPPPSPPKPSPSRKLRLLIPLGLLLVAAGFGARVWFNRSADQDLQLSGRIEGYETNLGAKSGGRIESVAVREGDRVQQGQVIARLEDDELQAEYAAARANVAAAMQQMQQAQSQIQVIQSQIQEAQLVLQQSEGETAGQVSQAEATVATVQAQLAEAQAQVQQAEAELQLAQTEFERYQSLFADGVSSRQELDQAQARLATAQSTLEARRATVAAAERQVSAAQGGLTQAATTQLNPDIRTAQLSRLQTQLGQANAQMAATQAEVQRAIAQQNEVAARLSNLEIVSPIDGVVVTRLVEPGEVIAAGATVLTVINLDEVYLRGYLPEGQIGQVRVGQPAQVFLDSAPDQALAATVIAIDTEASFTPENVYFQDDRVTQVFGLKLGIENPNGFAKPGMPADGEILLLEDATP